MRRSHATFSGSHWIGLSNITQGISILILSPCPGSPMGKMGGTRPTKQRGPAPMEMPLMSKTASAIYQRKVETSKKGMEDIPDKEYIQTVP